MNHIFRLVWSDVLKAWVAVAEKSRCRGKGSNASSSLAAALALAALTLAAPAIMAAPVGGQVTAGAASIVQAGAVTTITQASQNLSLNWNSFNIGKQEIVNFVQPTAAAIAVNRIADVNGTQILGHLNANGQVYLINPNGILFGQSAQVNVGALVASTLDLNDASLSSKARAFFGRGAGSVLNQGTINAASGGYVALLGNHVGNTGVITAQLGMVVLGAGSAATLNFSGNSLVGMQVDQNLLAALAENGGVIKADGGAVIMAAGAKDALVASVVNNTGLVQARTVQNHAGVITLLGGMAAGSTKVDGTLDASAPNGGSGGFIETSAAQVTVANGAIVTTAGSAGNFGTWLIDPHDFLVAPAGTANNNMTGAALDIALNLNNVTLLSSASSVTGLGNMNINDTIAWSTNTVLTLQASNNVNINGNITATGNTAGLVLSPNTANSTAVNGNTDAASGSGVFNLKNGASITLTGTAPTLSIAGSAYTIINTLGALADATSVPATPSLQGIAASSMSGHYALGSNIDASATSNWGGGTGFVGIGAASPFFSGVFDGLGHTINNLSSKTSGLFNTTTSAATIQNVGLTGTSTIGVANVSTQATNITNLGALVDFNQGSITNSYSTINLCNYNDWSTAINPFSGAVNYTGGLVGKNSGVIRNSYVVESASGSINGGVIGGLVGFNMTGGSISNSYAVVLGTAEGSIFGGLAGGNTGTITNSYANLNITTTVTPNSNGGYNDAGLVGENFGAGVIDSSYAFGAISSADAAAGLVITNRATIKNSYSNFILTTPASNATNASSGSGMLVFTNDNTGTISNSYAIGKTVGTSHQGLFGSPSDSTHVTNSYWNNASTDPDSTGTPTGSNTSSFAGGSSLSNIQMATASNFVGWDFGSTWVLNGNTNATTGNVGPLLIADKTTVTLTANAAKFYDTKTFTGGSVTASANYAGNVTGNLAYAGASQSAVNANTYALTASGLTSTNQQLTIAYASGFLTVNPNFLYVNFSALSKTYDGNTNATLTGLATINPYSSDNANVILGGNGTGVFVDKNVGDGKSVSVIGSYSISGSSATNYTLVQPTTDTGSITRKALTASVTAASKAYDGSTNTAGTTAAPVLTITSGLVGTETVSVTGVASYDFKDVSKATKVTVNSTALADGSNGGLASNYSLAAGQSVADTITPTGLIASVAAVSKVYDGSTNTAGTTAAPVLTITSGLVGTETVSVTGVASYDFKDVSKATKVTVNSTALSDGSNGGLASNYSLAAGQSVADTITPTGLIASVASVSKVYDGSTNTAGTTAAPVLTITSGLVGTETVSATGVASYDFKDVSKATKVTVNSTALADGSNGGLASNYSLASGQSVADTITQRSLTASVSAASKVYDGSTNTAGTTAAPVLTITSGLVGTETVSATVVASYDFKDVSKASQITVSSLTLADGSGLASNYSLVAGQSVADTITPKALIAAVASVSKVYDGNTNTTGTTAAPVLTITSGLVGTETVNATGVASYDFKDVSKASKVTVSSITLADGSGLASNYSLVSGQSVADTITQKALTASVAAASKVYDGSTNMVGTTAAPMLSITSGLVGTETVNVTGVASYDFKDVSKASKVTVSSVTLADGINGGLASNYSLVSGQSVADTITQKALTASVAAGSKVYDGSTNTTGTTAAPVLTITSGLVGTETVNATGVASYDFKDVNKASKVTVSSITLADGSGLASNYSLVSGQSVADTITQKALTASVAAASKVYDGSTNTVGTTAAPMLSITSGLVGTETVNATGVASYDFKDVSKATKITVSSVTLADGIGLASNYSLASGATANASITAKTLSATLTSASASKVYDGTTTATPVLNIAPSGLIGSESVTATGVGTFNSKDVLTASSISITDAQLIDGSHGGLASNYQLAFNFSGPASVTARSINLTGSRMYDGTALIQAGAITFNTGVSGESLNLTGAGSVASSNVSSGIQNLELGSLALTNGSAMASNYLLNGGTASITAKVLTATVMASNKKYDGATVALSTLTLVNGLVGSETVTASGTATFNSKDVASANLVTVNSTVLTDGGNGGLASNYQLASGQTVAASITPLTVTAVASNQIKTFGSADAALTYSVGALVPGDTVATVLGGSLTRASGELAGQYAINQGSLASINDNYSLAFTPASLRIAARVQASDSANSGFVSSARASALVQDVSLRMPAAYTDDDGRRNRLRMPSFDDVASDVKSSLRVVNGGVHMPASLPEH